MRKRKTPTPARFFWVAALWAMVLLAGCALPLKDRRAFQGGPEDLVKIRVTPPFDFRFQRMRTGVLQHLDRKYTYDVVPPELVNGWLFQGIHRPPAGTALEIELTAPAVIYFFFHPREDGGYTAIFSTLENWERCAAFPRYDIHNGDHGLKMVMYKLEARAGTYFIPPTTRDRACFNIVFQARGQ